jgi:cell division protein FtsW
VPHAAWDTTFIRTPGSIGLGTEGAAAAAELRRAEALIMAAALSLAGLGLVMIYNASGVLSARFGSPTFFLEKQAAWTGVAIVAFACARRVDYHLLCRRRKAVLLGTVALLVAVLIPGIGVRLNGARRWIRFAGVGFQPSDLAKLGVVTYLAGYLEHKRDVLGVWRKGFLPAAVALGVVVGLIALEPDVGTSVLVACVGGSVLLMGGVRIRHVLPAVLLAAPVAAGYVLLRLDYVRARVFSFLDPSLDPLGAGYHARQSLIALAAGGVFGRGLGCGSQKLFFLPEAHTDFIFSIIGEELGLVGSLFVVGAFLAILAGAAMIVRRAADRSGALLAAGIAFTVCAQAALNVAVVTASVPTKGIPLPLVSYGGSALVVSALGLGMLTNVAGHGISLNRRGFGGAAGEGAA